MKRRLAPEPHHTAQAPHREYETLAETDDGQFNSFRQRVEIAEIRCLAVPPSEEATEEEIRELLEELQGFCTGRLAQFRRFVDEALQAL